MRTYLARIKGTWDTSHAPTMANVVGKWHIKDEFIRLHGTQMICGYRPGAVMMWQDVQLPTDAVLCASCGEGSLA